MFTCVLRPSLSLRKSLDHTFLSLSLPHSSLSPFLFFLVPSSLLLLGAPPWFSVPWARGWQRPRARLGPRPRRGLTAAQVAAGAQGRVWLGGHRRVARSCAGRRPEGGHRRTRPDIQGRSARVAIDMRQAGFLLSLAQGDDAAEAAASKMQQHARPPRSSGRRSVQRADGGLQRRAEARGRGCGSGRSGPGGAARAVRRGPPAAGAAQRRRRWHGRGWRGARSGVGRVGRGLFVFFYSVCRGG